MILRELFLPPAAGPVLLPLAGAFTRPTFRRVLVLLVGAVLASGGRTVTGMIRAAGLLATGHYSSYHRVFSRANWSLWHPGRILAAPVVALVPPGQPVPLALDDTSPQHKGPHVYGKGRHRDACRSSHSHTVWVWGHKWVVLAVLVQFPFARRPWALPVLAALYRDAETNGKEHRRHKTPVDLARQLLRVLIRWFPGRRFIAAVDGGFSCHELCRFARRHREHLTLVGKFYPDAQLFEPPARNKLGKNGRPLGRPRVKGEKLPTPRQAVAGSKILARATVNWYGGKTREIEYAGSAGFWYKSGHGLAELRWVFVRDLTGTHREEYFFCTDPSLTPEQIVAAYTGRWSIEVTFQEVRKHLGFATPRNWRQNSVLRTGPCLLALFSIVSLIYHEHLRQLRGRKPAPHKTPWYDKPEPTFSDALAAVRRLFWTRSVFAHPPLRPLVQKLPSQLRNFMLDRLALAG